MQKKKDAKITLEFESLEDKFLEKHPKLKIRKQLDIYINRYNAPIDDIINELSNERDRLLESGASNITVEFDYTRGYYDSIEFESRINYEVEESDFEYQKRLVALKRASVKAAAARRKEKIDQEAAEKELYAKLKAKFEN